ncbi:MAG TPA: hypothetical protein VGC88_11625 [Terriglobales bacterium]|jgi:membrane-bound metal-dependent hydrolase YbcI (DUF457 family)
MLLGHYGPALALAPEQRDSKLRLWHLFAAVQLMDICWSVLISLGAEKVRVIPGFLAASPLDLYYMPFTHGLLGSLLISAVAGYLFSLYSKSSRDGLVIAVAVFSHWILDLVVHRPDLPLWGNSYKVGFGMWRSLPLTIVVETLVYAIGVYLYSRRHAGWKRLVVVGVFTAALQYGTLNAPPPPNNFVLAGMALFMYVLLCFVAVWVEPADEQRPVLKRAAPASH